MITDISRKRLLVLPKDSKELGIPDHKLELALAMRMSMSFPFFFVPVVQNGLWIMDGGVLSNFPYWYIDRLETGWDEPRYPTVGLLLEEPPSGPIKGVISIGGALLSTMISPLDQAYSVYKERVIKIDVQNISTLDFNLKQSKKDCLYQNGRRAASNFLAGFDYWKSQQTDIWEGWGSWEDDKNPQDN